MREHEYPMIFTTTSQEVLTQHCSIRGQGHNNDKLGCLLIVVHYCGSNCCSGPTTMLEKERIQVSTRRPINYTKIISFFYSTVTSILTVPGTSIVVVISGVSKKSTLALWKVLL